MLLLEELGKKLLNLIIFVNQIIIITMALQNHFGILLLIKILVICQRTNYFCKILIYYYMRNRKKI